MMQLFFRDFPVDSYPKFHLQQSSLLHSNEFFFFYNLFNFLFSSKKMLVTVMQFCEAQRFSIGSFVCSASQALANLLANNFAHLSFLIGFRFRIF